MNSDNELKNDIKNHTCYHFEDIININDLNFDNILTLICMKYFCNVTAWNGSLGPTKGNDQLTR